MRSPTALIISGLMLLAGSASAQIDPASCGVGIYFDREGYVNCLCDVASGTYGPGLVYLLITNPDLCCEVHGLGGFEAVVEIEGPLEVLDWGLQGGGLNVATPPEFVVGYSPPLVFDPQAVLLDLTVMVTGSGPIYFRIFPVSLPGFGPWPAYVCAYDLCEPAQLIVSTGLDEHGDPNPCATINGDCPVPAQESSWGSVKALYR